MSFIASNWELILSVVFLVVLCVVYVAPQVITFIGYPTNKKTEMIKKLMLNWVTLALVKFDEGDFDFIVNYCYDAFMSSKLSYLAKNISEEQFRNFVEDALTTIKNTLAKTNKTVAYLKAPTIANFSNVVSK